MPGEATPTTRGIKALLDAEAFRKYRERSLQTRAELHELLSAKVPGYTSVDTSLVVFGSLARGEQTYKSDLDWTYLIDGQAIPDHLKISQNIREHLKGRIDEPGQTGTFGSMAFSHDIIHQIGGQYDTNRNTTQRILLLLESRPIGIRTDGAYERVIRAVIDRYLEEDTHLVTHDIKSYRVPRFLLNDIVRFWRTMAVDFASKQRDRAGKGWGLRNAKLRLSRKLIFASGLLICFSVNLDPNLQSQISTDKNEVKTKLSGHIRNLLRLTPLEILATSMEQYGVSTAVAKDLFGAYAEFLTILDDHDSREALDALRAEFSRTDALFQRVRRISERFENALDHIFFENALVAPLTRKYGVF